MTDFFLSLMTILGFCYHPAVQDGPIYKHEKFQFTAYCDIRFCPIIQNSADELNRQAKERFNSDKDFIQIKTIDRMPREAVLNLPFERLPNHVNTPEKALQILHEPYLPIHGNYISEISFGSVNTYPPSIRNFDGRCVRRYDFSISKGGVYEADIIINDRFYLPLQEPEIYFWQAIWEGKYMSKDKSVIEYWKKVALKKGGATPPKPQYDDKNILDSYFYVPYYWRLETILIHEMLHATAGLSHTKDPGNIMWGEAFNKTEGEVLNETRLTDAQWEAIRCIYYED